MRVRFSVRKVFRLFCSSAIHYFSDDEEMTGLVEVEEIGEFDCCCCRCCYLPSLLLLLSSLLLSSSLLLLSSLAVWGDLDFDLAGCSVRDFLLV